MVIAFLGFFFEPHNLSTSEIISEYLNSTFATFYHLTEDFDIHTGAVCFSSEQQCCFVQVNDFVKAKMWLFVSILNTILCKKKKNKIVG